MELRIMTEPQEGATYDQLLALAQRSEQLGFGAFFRSDHYLRIHPGGGGPGSTDAWATLAGLARETSTIRLGTMVTSATFRLPGPLAISVATVDAMSGGRVEFGLGAGWYDREHEAYGIPFPPTGERFERLEEQLQIVTGLWATPAGETFSHDGEHYSVDESPALPKPAQEKVPVIIGGHGPKRTPRLAATYADEFNVPFSDLDGTRTMFERVRAACEVADRDPESIIYSACQTVAVGADVAEYERRARAIDRDPTAMRGNEGVSGLPDEAIERIAAFAELGATRLYLQVLDVDDLDHLDLIAEQVKGRV